MPDTDLTLYAHLMRRAGFGATRTELEELTTKSYDQVIDDLIHPERIPDIDEDVLMRYYPELMYLDSLGAWVGRWMYRMINSTHPLEEKMTLFWHHVFATGWDKGEHTPTMVEQIETFRRFGMSDMRTILVALAKDPAMNYWLDNCENHAAEPNENWGRELLELFSMGVGHYEEADIKNAARAFTGWTFTQPIPLYPYGHFKSDFIYIEDDHDNSEKTFLGETGNFNGEDIIDIVVKQKATARFICRHLYNFFVADEPQVPAWELEEPNDPAAIEVLEATYFENNGQIRPILKTLFTSDFFKEARYKKIKSPVELVAGTMKLVGTHTFPDEGLTQLGGAPAVMGQVLMNPATVEGWHTGKEWIDGGTLNQRINFAVNQVTDISKPGIQDIIGRLSAEGTALSPQEFVDRCVDFVGTEPGEDMSAALLKYASKGGELRFDTESNREDSSARVGRMLQFIVASREYQFA